MRNLAICLQTTVAGVYLLILIFADVVGRYMISPHFDWQGQYMIVDFVPLAVTGVVIGTISVFHMGTFADYGKVCIIIVFFTHLAVTIWHFFTGAADFAIWIALVVVALSYVALIPGRLLSKYLVEKV